MPPGSVMKVPDSLWQSYIYASLLSGSALRGCRVLVIAPTQDSAPSAGAPQLARAHGLMGRLIVFGNELEQSIAAAGGLLKVGLYAPRQGVGDIAGRIAQSMDTEPGWSDRVYPFHRDFAAAADKVPAQLDSLGYSVRYLAATDSIAQPKMHLKANFFASKIAWDKLIAGRSGRVYCGSTLLTSPSKLPLPQKVTPCPTFRRFRSASTPEEAS